MADAGFVKIGLAQVAAPFGDLPVNKAIHINPFVAETRFHIHRNSIGGDPAFHDIAQLSGCGKTDSATRTEKEPRKKNTDNRFKKRECANFRSRR